MTPEADLLRQLLSAVEHYERMGWLSIPEAERWKYEALVDACRAVDGRPRAV